MYVFPPFQAPAATPLWPPGFLHMDSVNGHSLYDSQKFLTVLFGSYQEEDTQLWRSHVSAMSLG